MGRRAAQIAFAVVAAIFLVEMFSPLQVATCGPKVTKADAATRAISVRGSVSASAPVAFQVHGGDNAFIDGMRGAFKDELLRVDPHATFVDGPPPKDGVLVRVTLTNADLRWTPFYSHNGLTAHEVIQLPGARAGTQITEDATLEAVCTGLVSRSRFQAHEGVLVPLAAWLVGDLMDARAAAPK